VDERRGVVSAAYTAGKLGRGEDFGDPSAARVTVVFAGLQRSGPHPA